MKGNLDFSEENIKDLIYAECKALEITAKKFSDSTIAGAYKSIKRGSGIEFEEARLYTPSDDARRIDWKVTARKQKPYIKSFREERDQSMFIVVDGTYSTLLGRENTKSKKILEAAAFIGSIASFNQDKIGSICFSNTYLHFNKAKRGFSCVYKILHDIISLSVRSNSAEQDLQDNFTFSTFREVLRSVQRLVRRRSKIFLISDFSFEIDFETDLMQLASKQDLYCICMYDAIEDLLPSRGTYITKNPETGEEHVLQLSNSQVRNYLITQIREHRANLQKTFTRHKIPYIALHTTSDMRESLFKFFKRL